MSERMSGYINVYANGRTSKLCPSIKAADHTASQVNLYRIGIWRVEFDKNGRNPAINVCGEDHG
jgi:hypothetical protein